MNKRIKISSRRRVITYAEDEKAPFWLEHLLGLIITGLVLIVGGMIVLSLTDWGRVTMAWLGLGLGGALFVWLLAEAWRSLRTGERAMVWIGEAIGAFGWGGMAAALGGGIPFVFWRSARGDLPEWAFALPGIGAVAFTGVAMIGMWMQTRGPLPALDRTPRSARVVWNTEDPEGGQNIAVRYRGADGEHHEAELADLIDDSSLDRFAVSTTWQIYAFQDVRLSDAVVFLTEEHDDVWRDGYKLDGVRLGGESGPLKPGPGSPFLREGGRWEFEQ